MDSNVRIGRMMDGACDNTVESFNYHKWNAKISEKYLNKIMLVDKEYDSFDSHYQSTNYSSPFICNKCYNFFLSYSNLHTNKSILLPSEKTNFKDNSSKIIIFNDCIIDFHKISFETIYQFYDHLISFFHLIRLAYPYSIIVWILPSLDDLKRNEYNFDLILLHGYLMLKYLVQDNGIIILPFQHDQQKHLRKHQLLNNDNVVKSIVFNVYKIATIVNDVMDEKSIHNNNKIELNVNTVDNMINLVGSSLHSLYENQFQKLAYFITKNKHTSFQFISNHINHYAQYNKALYERCFKNLNSRLYDPQCMPKPAILLPVLITGTI
jgi:hypothetical protein